MTVLQKERKTLIRNLFAHDGSVRVQVVSRYCGAAVSHVETSPVRKEADGLQPTTTVE